LLFLISSSEILSAHILIQNLFNGKDFTYYLHYNFILLNAHCSSSKIVPEYWNYIFCSHFFPVLGFELRASPLVGKCSTTWATLPAHYCFLFLTYNHCTLGCIMIFTYVLTMYLGWINPLYHSYSFILSPFVLMFIKPSPLMWTWLGNFWTYDRFLGSWAAKSDFGKSCHSFDIYVPIIWKLFWNHR
jgi:hypothetical protein